MTDEQRLRDVERNLDKLENVAEKVERHDEIIFGNGTMGLKTKMELIEQTLNEIKERQKARSSLDKTILGGVILLVIGKLFDVLSKVL